METKAGEYTFEEMATWPDEDLRPVFSEESWKTGSGLETKTRQEELSAAIAATRSSFQAPPNILDGSTTCWYSPPPSKDLAKKSYKCGLKQQIVARDDKSSKRRKTFPDGWEKKLLILLISPQPWTSLGPNGQQAGDPQVLV